MTLELEIGLNSISSYKRLAYSPWHAIAEFVDNSTQSFFNNEKVLRAVAEEGVIPLTVMIEYDRKTGILRISDNAMGMSLAELTQAMIVANPPSIKSGRSKYGMGLKTAAAWLGNNWVIRTKKLGESVEYTVTIDVDKVAAGDSELKLDEEPNCPTDTHYTEVEITRHNRDFRTKTITKVGSYLSSMYREDFRNKLLTLTWQGEKLSWKELDGEMLVARDGNKYKRDFEFDITIEIENKRKLSKHVHGWVGVLAEGSRTKAGFSILHSGRVVRGWPDAWRPETLYGQIQGSNDLINQRLVGEIHLDAFDVSHTKDDILWLGEEEELVENELRKKCGEYRDVARTYRKHQDDGRGPNEVAVKTAIDRLKRELISPEMADIIKSNPMLPEKVVAEVVASVKGSIVGKFPETFSAIIDSVTIKGYVDEMSVNDPYLTIDTAVPSEIVIIVNASHPHWNQLKGSDGVLNYLRHCTYDGIAEAQARDKTSRSVKINPNTVKLLKDRLLRIPFEIEQNTDEDESTESL